MIRSSSIAGTGSHWTALYAGDNTLIIEFGNSIERATVDRVNTLDALLKDACADSTLTGILETVTTFRSLAIIYDACVLHPQTLLEQIRTLEASEVSNAGLFTAQRHWQLPVLYGEQAGPDLNSVAELTGLDTEHVIQLHSEHHYSAYMLGFLPGYAFLGDTPSALHLPRRTEPRLRVPAGSVAIAMQLTGVYPWESPGGWHILGNCPVPMFDSQLSPPSVLRAGDRVSFRRIDKTEFDALKNEPDIQQQDRSRWAKHEHTNNE